MSKQIAVLKQNAADRADAAFWADPQREVEQYEMEVRWLRAEDEYRARTEQEEP